jgi:tyrosyl-tRNA synthetase
VNCLDVLRERGFVQQVSNEQGLRAALERPITLYCGYDPTRDSLQVGNLISIMMLAHLQRGGHRPIALIGGGTTMIGDPSGKTEMREMLTQQQIEQNGLHLRQQFARYLDFSDDRALMLNNADWLLRLEYVPFLREIGRHFSVNQLLQHETYRERLSGGGLNFIELNYALLQAYDFLHLYRECDCALQVGGTDQWFNILAGVELVRREAGREVFALVSPLISTASGAKMGKTEAGAVWLDPTRTSPYEFYQYWINTEDSDVERFLKLFTFLPLDEIQRLAALTGADIRRTKEVLAFEATRLTHGEEAARRAQEDSRALFGSQHVALGGRQPPPRGKLTVEVISAVPTTKVSRTSLEDGLGLVDALILTGLAASRSAAKRQIQAGGVYVNQERVANAEHELSPSDLEGAGQILLRRGKKEYRRIVAG